MNRLVNERSAYLRHAANQKIDWHPWSDEAFEKAENENKPVFLSTGAVWCHWCHVMAAESFEDEEVAAFLNEKFVAVKLDRDERPDIDRRYQRAVSAMGNGGGWPLSVFLTPDRQAFFGGTYFPPQDAGGRPGFMNILRTVHDFYMSKRNEAGEYAARLTDFLRPDKCAAGEIDKALAQRAARAITAEYDAQNGGFGTSPKFPMPGALEFLMNRFCLDGNESLATIVKKTLDAMAKGGFHDHLGGGFHRYSVDEAWLVPHFEKMADDNAWLLRNYLAAFSLFGEERYKAAAEGIITFFTDLLSSPDGGFYSSQDADVTPDDEGGYFTWTDEDFKRTLTAEEYRVMSLYLLHERGKVGHGNDKMVLFEGVTPEEISVRTGIAPAAVAAGISAAKDKLLKTRNERQAPFIDSTFYTSLNGLCVTAFINAFTILGDERLLKFGLRSLRLILDVHYKDNRLLHTTGVAAVLDDYIFLIEALVAAYEATGDETYLTRADELMLSCTERFLDRDAGGFFDTEEEVLGVRLKIIEDVPHPSANAIGIVQLLKLHNMTGRDEYRGYAAEALGFFAGASGHVGVHSGYYACAIDAYFNMLRLTVEAPPESRLATTVRSAFIPYKSIRYGEDNGRVVPCLGTTCFEPLHSPEEIREFLKRRGPA